MSILPLAALPAATSVARDAVAGSAQVGKSFLNLLASWTDGATESQTKELNSATSTPSPKTANSANDSITQRTHSLGQRLASWLRQQSWLKNSGNHEGRLTIDLSLDQLDRPHATLSGQPSAQLDEALANDPSWLEEFRSLALDRIEQMGSAYSNSPLQSLTIQQDSGTMAPETKWN